MQVGYPIEEIAAELSCFILKKNGNRMAGDSDYLLSGLDLSLSSCVEQL